MTLDTWLKEWQIDYVVFAKEIGKNRSVIFKCKEYDVIPKRETIIIIYIATCGQVSANDFHGLSEQLYVKDLIGESSKKKLLRTNMILKQWLKWKRISIDEFAKIIGKNRSLVFKYVCRGVIPGHETIVAIYIVTLGVVSANEFYGLSEKLLDKNPAKKSPKKEVLHANSFRY